jgi:hypothetical protein
MSVRLLSGKGPRAGAAAADPSGHTRTRRKTVRPLLATGLVLTATDW